MYEQCESLRKQGIEIEYFIIQGKGLKGYIRNIFRLRKKVTCTKYDIVHAHYGLSGLLAVFQSRCPVVTSFIGEMNFPILRFLSKFAMRLSSQNIFVSEQLIKVSKAKRDFSIIPYGVNLDIFYPLDKDKARDALKIAKEKKLCLFPSSRDRKEKNFPLAKQAVDLYGDIEIIELMKGYARKEINLFINACDFVLMTSRCEGSPQVIKEAMACNCPIISTDVGDVREIIKDTNGCYITTSDPKDIAKKIQCILKSGKRTDGREKIKHLEINQISLRIINVYRKALNRKVIN